MATLTIEPEVSPRRPPVARTCWRNGFWLTLAVAGAVSAVFRLVSLGRYPERFNQDAMVLGYDAWCVWLTGRDHHGDLLPVFFRTFDDYVPPVPNYLAAPFVGLFGLSETTTRLPFALLGVATVVLTGLLGRRWFGPWAGLVAAGLLAVEPWHVNYSRIAHPAGVVPFFTVAALYTFTRAVSARRLRYVWFLASGVSLALLFMSYPSLKMQAPLLALACAVGALVVGGRSAIAGHGRSTVAGLAVWAGTFAVVGSPLVISQARNWDLVQARFESFSVLRTKHPAAEFLTAYAEHFNPGALFFRGLRGGLGVLPTGIGELFWLEWPLLIVGIVVLVRRGPQWPVPGLNVAFVVLVWGLTFPVASSLTTADIPHEIRSYNVVPLPELLAGFGAVVAWRWLSTHRPALRYLVGVTALLVFVIFIGVFGRGFFGLAGRPSPDPNGPLPYNVGLRAALERVSAVSSPCDLVYLEPENQTYVYYLFLTRSSPSQLQRPGFMHEARRIGAQIDRVGHVRFELPGPASLPDEAACPGQPSRTFFVTHSMPADGRWATVDTAGTLDGRPIWYVLVAT